MHLGTVSHRIGFGPNFLFIGFHFSLFYIIKFAVVFLFSLLNRILDSLSFQVWCSSRHLQLNPTKTELIWFGSELNLDRIATADVSVRFGDTVIQPCDRVRDLGVILDSSLSMRLLRHHIAKVTSTCFFHLRRLRKIGHILDKNSRCRLVCAFILTRIDYCNALYAELPDSTLAPLYNEFFTLLSASLSVSEHETLSQEP